MVNYETTVRERKRERGRERAVTSSQVADVVNLKEKKEKNERGDLDSRKNKMAKEK